MWGSGKRVDTHSSGGMCDLQRISHPQFTLPQYTSVQLHHFRSKQFRKSSLHHHMNNYCTHSTHDSGMCEQRKHVLASFFHVCWGFFWLLRPFYVVAVFSHASGVALGMAILSFGTNLVETEKSLVDWLAWHFVQTFSKTIGYIRLRSGTFMLPEG